MPELYQHQKNDVQFYLENEHVLNFSDPGTGKTPTLIEVIRQTYQDGKTLVLGPKSILEVAWAADLHRFAPELRYTIAWAENRKKAFASDADVYITNHDAVKTLVENASWLKGFNRLIIDESIAYANRNSQRSKAIRKLSQGFAHRTVLNGTPFGTDIGHIWHQAIITDGGQRLGKSFWAFYNQVAYPIQTGPLPEHRTWHEKDGARELIYSLVADITIRNKLEDVIEIPENFIRPLDTPMNKKHRKIYDQFAKDAVLKLRSGEVIGLNKAQLRQKLYQIASGAVYTGDSYEILDKDRYNLTMDLIEAREQCVVAFLWAHQKELLVKEAERRGFQFAVIDGATPAQKRSQYVDEFQAGRHKIMFMHPVCGAYGITLTSGTSTIWASPTPNPVWWKQLNARIHRNGQTRKTETIVQCAPNSIESEKYDILTNRATGLSEFLSLFERAA